jgi:putative beta-barrel porin BBP2
MPKIIECSSDSTPPYFHRIESNKVIVMIDSVWRKTRAVCLFPFATLRERKWPFALILTFLVACEVFSPVGGQAQSLSDLGAFYFTGSHRPIIFSRSTYFREFMTGRGVGDGLKAGPVQLHPFLGVAEVYTDNVFKRDTNTKSDFLTTIAPGLQAFMPFGGGKHSVLLDYRAAQFLYNKFSENNALAQDAVGHVSLNYPGGLAVDLQGGHEEGFDPRGSEVDTQQKDITKWNVNSFLGRVEFEGQKAGISLRTNFDDVNYTNNGQAAPRDRTRAVANLSVSVAVTRSTRALLGVRIINNDYNTNTQQNSFGYGAYTGFSLAPIRQLSGDLNIGYQVLNFDHAPISEQSAKGQALIAQGLSLGSKQQTFFYMRGNLNWNPTSRSSFQIQPISQINQSAVQGTSTYKRMMVNVIGRQEFTDRFALRGILTYANDNFNTNRTDNRFRFRIGPEYRTVKWLGFRLDYIFDKRSSNVSNFDFNSNTIMLSIQGIL